MFECMHTFNQEKATQLALGLAYCRVTKNWLSSKEYKEHGVKRQSDFLEAVTAQLSTLKLEGLKIKTGKSLKRYDI